ncbi:GatB/YqeY domain-containing protein [Biscogniauxia marginata]|nr:GatB/YqeY domain-containing protein [Biscogniauxia marginata]
MAALRPSIPLPLLTRLATRTPTHHPPHLAFALAQSSVRSPTRFPAQYLFHYSTETTAAATTTPPPPPLLQKLKTDLKTAMRAKDAPRLTVLRSILSAALNASKTASPVSTDAQVVGLLRRARRATEEARAEAEAAGRADLVEREEAQVRVLDEYVAGSGVEELGAGELRALVAGAVDEAGGKAKAKMGDVMKALLAPGGPLAGKDVEKGELAKTVKEVIG